jgi:hypothetical protein
LLRVEFVWELDLKRLRIDLDDHTLTPLEKIAQVVNKLGVAEPQSHPQKALPDVPCLAVAYSHCHRERRLVNAHECLTAVRVAVLALLTAAPAGFTSAATRSTG